MTQDLNPTVTRPAPLPGHVGRADVPFNIEMRRRVSLPQIATATLVAGFNGARLLGISYDGALVQPAAQANTAGWLSATNAVLLTALGLAEVTEAAGVVTVTSRDFLAHTLTPSTPDAPDLDLSAFTVTQAAVAAPVSKPGMGVVWQAPAIALCQAPLPTSTLVQYAGFLDRATEPPRDLATAWGGAPGVFPNGAAAVVVHKGSGYLRVYPGAVVTALGPVWLGRTPGEAGYYFGEDSLVPSRLQITGAMWTVSGTGPADESYGIPALFT